MRSDIVRLSQTLVQRACRRWPRRAYCLCSLPVQVWESCDNGRMEMGPLIYITIRLLCPHPHLIHKRLLYDVCCTHPNLETKILRLKGGMKRWKRCHAVLFDVDGASHFLRTFGVGPSAETIILNQTEQTSDIGISSRTSHFDSVLQGTLRCKHLWAGLSRWHIDGLRGAN